MKSHWLAAWRIPAFALSILLLAQPCLAAPEPSRTDIEDQNRRARQEAEDRQQRQSQRDVFLQQKQSLQFIPLPEEALSFPIDSIVLEGDPDRRFHWLQAVADRFAGQKIGREGINLIIKQLTAACIDKGYITTRIAVPEQDLHTGLLRMSIITGKIEAIRLTDGSEGNWRSAFPARPGDILNLRDLEQGLEQMKRLSSQEVDMQIIPGNTPGGSIIEIAVKQTKPWNLVLSLDDAGSKATGRQQYSGTFSLENLWGRNDLFNLSVNSDAEQAGAVKGSRGDSFYYSLPRGYWTFSLSGYRNQYHQTVGSLAERFCYSGESDSLELTAERLVYRDQTRKTSLAASLIKNTSQSFVDDTEIGVQRRKTTAARLALSHRQYLGQTTLDAGLSWKHGNPRLGTADSLGGVSGENYSLWVVDTMLRTPVTILQTPAHYSLAAKLQYSRDRLPGNELFSIGNRYTVRGFDGEQTLMAEKGWYLRNELALPLAETSQLYLGLDCGRVSGPSAADLTGQTLVGAVAGLRGRWQNLQYELFAGRPLRKPAGLDTASTVFGFHATYNF